MELGGALAAAKALAQLLPSSTTTTTREADKLPTEEEDQAAGDASGAGDGRQLEEGVVPFLFPHLRTD